MKNAPLKTQQGVKSLLIITTIIKSAHLLSSGLYRRLWNFTKSAVKIQFAGYGTTKAYLTAGGEFHPAPKTAILT